MTDQTTPESEVRKPIPDEVNGPPAAAVSPDKPAGAKRRKRWPWVLGAVIVMTWEEHPDNIGHKNAPGCFRCHDGKHLSSDNQAIRLECNICHTIPEVALPGQQLPAVSLVSSGHEPETHRSTTWLAQHRSEFDDTCAGCHSVDNPGGTPNAIPHPIGERTDCAICHGAGKARPWREDHGDFTREMCGACHQVTLQEGPAAFVPWGTTHYAAPIEGIGDCTACHGPARLRPPMIPRVLTGMDNYLLCHSPEEGAKPAPEDHAGRAADSCRVCHRPQS